MLTEYTKTKMKKFVPEIKDRKIFDKDENEKNIEIPKIEQHLLAGQTNNKNIKI